MIVLENGDTFSGQVPDWSQEVYGEVVFTTGMTGYPETLTDPSYADQIIVFTYPLIGNYGVGEMSNWESKKIHAVGVVVNQACLNWSHSKGKFSLEEWLKAQGISLIKGVDTRALTQVLREKGTLNGKIGTSKTFDPVSKQIHPVTQVSCKEPEILRHGKKKVIVVDTGAKESILKELCRFDLTLKKVPHNFDYTLEDYDGIVLSNGPGDPKECLEEIAILKKAFEIKKPIFGICLGAQLMALAAGGKTYKLPFGHRGHNQPCFERKTKRAVITSQNHGYAIEENSLSSKWQVTHHNLNDGSVEGIKHQTDPFFAVQFHPEAAPGPTDTRHLFNTFFESI